MDLARLGVPTGVVGCVGDDVFGQFVIDTLKGAGLDAASVRRVPDIHTSGTLIINVEGEDRRFIHTVGANARFTAADIPLDRLNEAKVLYVGGYRIMPCLDAVELARVFRQARSQGVKTVLDVVLPSGVDHWRHLEPLLPETDVFLPNTDEAAILTGLEDPCRQAERFHAAGAGTVVITCANEGTILLTAGQRLRAEAHRVTYVGGTGAGDAFDAGYIAGLLAGEDARGCLAWGSALGASCVRAISATESVFTRDEAREFMKANPLNVRTW
jgi:sugar/nucleoside kinase (ribokinase family)